MKRLFPALLSLSMFVAAGCAVSKGGQEQTPAPNQAAGSGEQTEVTAMVVSTWADDIQALAKKFEEKNPNIKIKLVSLPFRQMLEGVEVQMNSKKPSFDLFMVDGPLVSNYTVKGFLEPLDSYIGNDLKAQWVDSSLQAGSYGGKLMAAPMNTSTDVLYYNKDIFTEKKVAFPAQEPEKRMTWEDTVEFAKQLTFDKNGDGQTDVFGFTFRQVGRPYQLLPLANSLGAEVISKDGFTAEGFTNSDKMVQAGKFYYDMFNTWKISPKITPDETVEYFATGKVAMMIGSTAYVKIFQERGVPFGVAPFPYFKDNQAATPTGSFHLGVSSFSDKKQAAAEFIKFATTGEGSKLWFEQRNELPANKEVLNFISTDAKYATFPANTFRLGAYEAQNTAVPRPLSPGYLEWESLLTNAYEDMKAGVDPKKALDQAAQQSDRLLKKYESLKK
jgi:ABC-type glycerol-3-phosphate transport system substrate-binding protein